MMIGILLVCIAPVAAFIAHNFGTQRRIRNELAKPTRAAGSSGPGPRASLLA